jgi:DNA modification methylase
MSGRILIGDVRERLGELPDESVHCVVTSPPYWGLRDYGISGQLGRESTPKEYITRMVEVFGEVRRVLRPDGTLWLNLGDSYAGNRGQQDNGNREVNGKTISRRRDNAPIPRTDVRVPGLKAKDLVGIPWQLALALQADGWWLRSDIIWSKPNPMPESVTDRPTTAHEHVFLLSRSPRYFYDAEAVREPHQDTNGRVVDGWYVHSAQNSADYQPNTQGWAGGVGMVTRHREYNPAGRNLRSVWTIATQPYPEAHFATFPEELARRCIAAGTSERGCCPYCGAPWARVVERTSENRSNAALAGTTIVGKGHVTSQVREDHDIRNGPTAITATASWRPTCAHDADPTPCTVLDPFAGSGTTLAVADRLGRDSVGIELKPEYAELALKRIQKSRARHG